MVYEYGAAMALIILTIALVVIALTAVLNALVFPRLKPTESMPEAGHVSVLIPARNEATVIGDTVRRLLDQGDVAQEIIVLDDNSTDGTAEVALEAGQGDSRLRVVNGTALPAGWLGKNWACHQLAQQAQGDVLVFTDADVRWSPGALTSLLTQMAHGQADLQTVWPTQDTRTWGERLVVPLMGFAVLGYLPLPLVHHTPWPVFAAANGQCMAFRRSAYDTVGGHAAVRDQIVEDVALAQKTKAAGYNLRMADGGGLIACRMYTDWPQVRDGFGKNILAGHGNSLAFLALSTVFHWAAFVLPWVWFLVAALRGEPVIWPLTLLVLGVGVRMLTAAATGQRVLDGLLLPVSVLLMTIIAGRSVWWRMRYGGPRWKDRTIGPTAKGALHG